MQREYIPSSIRSKCRCVGCPELPRSAAEYTAAKSRLSEACTGITRVSPRSSESHLASKTRHSSACTCRGYLRMPLSAAPRMSITFDVLYSHIIPDLLSEHLHYSILVDDVSLTWNPFYTLPLVSHMFYKTCKKMSQKIFGNEEGDGGDFILGEIEFTRNLWVQAKLPLESSDQFPLPRPYEYRDLVSSKSLIRVYICTAIAHIFFNVDVLWPLDLEQEDLRNADSDLMDLELSDRPRRYIMRDDTMHRVYLPLTCAMKLCDDILPERLAYIIAKHLAEIVPRYSTMPVLLKYTQDLETYVARKHRVDIGTWVEWTYRTLSLIQGTPRLLEDMQCMGKLVKSFGQSTSVPQDVIKETNITTALQDVMLTDWESDTDRIRERAQNLLMDFAPEDMESDYEDSTMDFEDFPPEE